MRFLRAVLVLATLAAIAAATSWVPKRAQRNYTVGFEGAAQHQHVVMRRTEWQPISKSFVDEWGWIWDRWAGAPDYKPSWLEPPGFVPAVRVAVVWLVVFGEVGVILLLAGAAWTLLAVIARGRRARIGTLPSALPASDE